MLKNAFQLAGICALTAGATVFGLWGASTICHEIDRKLEKRAKRSEKSMVFEQESAAA